MRIALFTDTYYPETNGVSKTLHRLAAYLKRHGHQIKIVAPAYDNHEPTADIWQVPSKPFFLYPASQVAFPGQNEVTRVMDNFRPDLIHVATPAGLGLAGRRYALDKNLPLVASYHTNFDLYFRHYGIEFLEPLYWSFLQWFHRPCLRNYCPSHSTLVKLKEKGFGKLTLWSRGVDSQAFNPANRNPALRRAWDAQDKIILLYVGRLAREKNVESLFKAYRLLAPEVRSKAKIVIVGGGPLLEKLQGEAPEGTLFTGPLSGRGLSEAYAAGDIFTFTSATETFGNVLLEAMASGLPVISPRAGGAMESLREGVNGLGFEPGQILNFTGIIQTLIEDDSLLRNLGQGARNFAREQSWENIFSKLIDDYQEVAKEKFVSLPIKRGRVII